VLMAIFIVPGLLLPLLLQLQTTSAQICTWPNGEAAIDFLSCNPTAPQSSCCKKGEACLDNGYCLGSTGFVYRGACSGGWGGSSACPEACNELYDGQGANLYYCIDGDRWACGPENSENYDNPCAANSTDSEFPSIPDGGLRAQILLPWPEQGFEGCAMSSNSPYSIENSTGNATTDTCGECVKFTAAGATESADTANAHHCSNHAKIGEGVAIGLLFLISCALGAWAIWERKTRLRTPASTAARPEFRPATTHRPRSRHRAVQRDINSS
jgi:hypothetical protein